MKQVFSKPANILKVLSQLLSQLQNSSVGDLKIKSFFAQSKPLIYVKIVQHELDKIKYAVDIVLYGKRNIKLFKYVIHSFLMN